MDKVLKRRLIGASILIALAVIFVPMLLVDPDEVDLGSSDDFEVPPIPDSAREVRRIPLDPEAARVAEPQPRSSERTGRSEAPGENDDQAPRNASETPAVEEEIVLRPDLVEPRQADEADSPALEPPASESTDAQTSSPSTPDGSAAPSEPRPESRPETRDASPAADASPGDWVVQVASFGTRDSAEQVLQRLETLGHRVMRDEVVRGQALLYRLRTGPYATEASAQEALEQIAATVAGVEPIVRKLDDRLGRGMPSGFAVQVGSFVNQDNADGETERLDGLGFDAFRFSEQVGERMIWRVMVGPVAERAAAEELKTQLVDEAGVEGLVVSYP